MAPPKDARPPDRSVSGRATSFGRLSACARLLGVVYGAAALASLDEGLRGRRHLPLSRDADPLTLSVPRTRGRTTRRTRGARGPPAERATRRRASTGGVRTRSRQAILSARRARPAPAPA